MKKAFVREKSTPNPVKTPENTVKRRKKITSSYLENSGAYYLQRFMASSAQFKRVMTRKIDLSCRDHPDQIREDCLSLLDQVVIKFLDLGYLNDATYAQGLYHSLSQRGFSRQKIQAQMKNKGVPSELIAACQGDENSEHELAMAVRFIRRKKLGAFAIRESSQQKSLASLARNGFGYETAAKALALSRDDAEAMFYNLD
ncbi:MAG: RecX family transcriptional regulator [Alphaproteobacteria bacterium]|nr:RecX family transcriptional regulator [Alphaproteobacteria bacterium]MCB1551431.1 RecX family transcriptional regulator [Alphaproteobacteria bacterium]MCB9984444.1 RecX family transcriptional regulator [Micavibrio sp.]HPQ50107.1 regulatory protein RecX [Alphaproteobacteria bacterium]HRK97791.1 regulatory protein RecX [Alphaproteobacteria bacterium]